MNSDGGGDDAATFGQYLAGTTSPALAAAVAPAAADAAQEQPPYVGFLQSLPIIQVAAGTRLYHGLVQFLFVMSTSSRHAHALTTRTGARSPRRPRHFVASASWCPTHVSKPATCYCTRIHTKLERDREMWFSVIPSGYCARRRRSLYVAQTIRELTLLNLDAIGGGYAEELQLPRCAEHRCIPSANTQSNIVKPTFNASRSKT